MKSFVRSKISAAVIVAASTGLLAGCDPDQQYRTETVETPKTQAELAEYCGINVNELLADLKKEDPSIIKVLLEQDCDVEVIHRKSDGSESASSFDAGSMMMLLAAGGVGMLAGAAMANASERNQMMSRAAREENKRRASGGSGGYAASSAYVKSGSRANSAFSSGKKIQPAPKTLTTRSVPFSSNSSGSNRGSAYGGGSKGG